MAKKRYRRSGKALSTQQAQRISFHIDNLDPMGQGVSRDGQKVSFIGKTLPGERGTARLMKQRAGVSFARLDTLEHRSALRTEPSCPHYHECPGCHYQHTDYAQELRFKQAALRTLLQRAKIDTPAIELIGAPERLGYRNRVQLHYRHRYLGMADGYSDRIVEIPHCQLLCDDIKPTVQALYNNRDWQQHTGTAGHCEVYLHRGEVTVSWDKPYAQGGFTQVYAQMNDKLKSYVAQQAKAQAFDSVLDLFAGDGNLSQPFSDKPSLKRIMVDATDSNTLPDFHKMDLYAPETLPSLRKRTPKTVDLLLPDPPRKGMAELNAWLRAFKPKRVIYVSCNPATLVRDIRHCLPQYRISNIALLDLFPATQHFETVVCLQAQES